MIHWSFLLKESWGKYVVGIPVIIFIGMLITGIVLWWPKNKAARKQRFWFRWKSIKNWKRKNYDLHNIFGFYSSVFALIFAITGLFYAFFVIKAAIYFISSGGTRFIRIIRILPLKTQLNCEMKPPSIKWQITFGKISQVLMLSRWI